jgi:uncharacterized protein with GYD domain
MPGTGSADPGSSIDVSAATTAKANRLGKTAVVRLGNFRTTTLRAWSEDEMRDIIGRL